MQKRAVYAFLLIIGLVSVVHYYKMLFMQPSLLHAWAQADRLALAINFYDNDLNFFKPATFNLSSPNGITGVEFPIQSYCAALLGKIFGREHISISFRLLNILVTCIGLFFLFRAGYKRTRDFIFSLVTPLFFYSSPVFIYYTCNYLPDTAAASVCFIALYYVLEYIDNKKDKDALIANGLFLLSGLIKTSAALYLFGFTGFVVIKKLFFDKQHSLKSYAPVLLSFFTSAVILLGYYLYSRYLNETHGDPAIFISTINPFTTIDELNYYLHDRLTDLWLKEYFILPSYILLAAFFSAGVYYLMRTASGKLQLLLMAVLSLGGFIVAFLLGKQLGDHDYYIIAIFFPMVALVLLASVTTIRVHLPPNAKRPLQLAIASSLAVTFVFAAHHSRQRLKPDYYPFNTGLPWMVGGDKILDSLKIARNEPVMILGEDAPNLALYYFDRKGYTVKKDQQAEYLNKLALVMTAKNVQVVITSSNNKTALDQNKLSHDFTLLHSDDSIAIYRLKS